MSRPRVRPLTIFVAGPLLLAACVVLGLAWRAKARPMAARLGAGGGIKGLTSLVDQSGRPFSFAQLGRQTVVLNFIFTRCPSSCPTQVRALTAVQKALSRPAPSRSPGARVHFVSVSMDPAHDTPAVLDGYARSLGADLASWSFVTGAPDQIAWLHQHYNAQVKALAGGQFEHRVAVYLLDADQRLLQTYAARPLDERRLIDEIQTVDRLFNPPGLGT